jgi:hypothetical protein
MSPVVELPTIDYPETTPVDTLLPVGQDKRARGPIHRSPLVIGAAAAVLLAGTYVARSGAMPAHQAAPDNAPAPASTPAAIEMPAPPKPAAEVTASTSGPTFGPPSTPPVASKHPIVTSIGASPAAPVAGNAAAAIEPAPADVDLSVPSLPSGDSLAPKVQADSNAIRRILRAVGGKGEPAPHP